MPRPTLIDIDLAALKHNARLARSLAGKKQLMAAVKADAYGHGMLACAQTLSSVTDALAVAFTEEAIALRDAGLEQPILILEGPFDDQDLAEISAHGLWPVLHSHEQLALLEANAGCCPESVWIKIDTGMHRLGFAPDDIETVLARLEAAGCREIVLMSHLAFAEEPESDLTLRQLQRWKQLSERSNLKTSFVNSAGLITQLPVSSDWVRPGYMLYGGRASERFLSLPLAPVMHFTSAVMALRQINPGESVGYGGRWQAQRTTTVATVPVGYGDGYPGTAENGTPIWIAGALCPLVGRVSMDMITVDVTDHPHIGIGSPVELWGRQLSVDTVAVHAKTIGYELLTRMPQRAPRHYRHGTDGSSLSS